MIIKARTRMIHGGVAREVFEAREDSERLGLILSRNRWRVNRSRLLYTYDPGYRSKAKAWGC